MRDARWIVLGLLLSTVPAFADSLTVQSSDGRRAVQAVELRTPIVLDGVLDDEAWRDAPVTGEFVQAEPDEGRPASESTEVRVAFDREALYIAVYCRDAEAGNLIVNDIRKD